MDLLCIDMDGYDLDVLYTKGHVDLDKFLHAAHAEFTALGYDPPNIAANYVWIRYNPDPSGQYNYMVVDGTPGNHGTFPATATYCTNRTFRLFKTWPKMPK